MPIQVDGRTYKVNRHDGSMVAVFVDPSKHPEWKHTVKRKKNETDDKMSKRVSALVLTLREVCTARARQARRPPLSNGAARCAGWATCPRGRLGPCHARRFICLD